MICRAASLTSTEPDPEHQPPLDEGPARAPLGGDHAPERPVGASGETSRGRELPPHPVKAPAHEARLGGPVERHDEALKGLHLVLFGLHCG